MRAIKSKFILKLIIFAIAICVSTNVQTTVLARDITELSIEELMEIEIYVSVATRTPLEMRNTPGSVYVITSDEIERLPVFTVPDILRLVPGVYVTSSALGENITIRGFGVFPFSDKILFLIDGVPWNSPDKGGAPGLPHWDIFPIEQIKQIEVVKGPGSVLYGKNAFWGTINIVTKGANETEGIKAKFLAGERDTLSGSIQYGGNYKELEWSFLGKSYTQEGSIEMLKDSEDESNEAYLKLRYKGLTGSLYFKNYRQGSFRYTGSDWTADYGDPDWDFDTLRMEENLTNMSLEYRKDIMENFTSTTRFSLQHRKGSPCSSCHFGALNAEDSSVGVWGTRSDVDDEDEHDIRYFISQQIDYDFGKTGIGEHTVSGGFEGWYDIINRKIAETGDLIAAPDSPDDSIDGVSVFMQDQWSLLDRKVNFTLGVRLDHHEKSGYTFTKRVAFVGHPFEKVTLRASFSDAFKDPTWNDMYSHTFLAPERSSVNDPLGLDVVGGGEDLDDENIRQYECGIEYRFTPKLSVRVDCYYSEIHDMLIPVSTAAEPNTLRISNSDETGRIKGGELELEYRFAEACSLRLGYDYQWTNRFPKNQRDLFGNKVGASYAPENKIHGMLFIRPVENLDWNLSYFWSDSFWAQEDMYSHPGSPKSGKFSGYHLLDTRINYKLPSIKKVEPRIFVMGQNLLNEKVPQFLHEHDLYQESPGTGMAGRRIVIGFEFKF